MSGFVIVLLMVAAAFVGSCALVYFYDNDIGYRKPRKAWVGWVGAWVFGISLFFGGLMACIIYPARAVGHTTCRNWARETGYPTKFRVLNWADTGTCLARTRGGRWVQNSHIIINVPDSGQK